MCSHVSSQESPWDCLEGHNYPSLVIESFLPVLSNETTSSSKRHNFFHLSNQFIHQTFLGSQKQSISKRGGMKCGQYSHVLRPPGGWDGAGCCQHEVFWSASQVLPVLVLCRVAIALLLYCSIAILPFCYIALLLYCPITILPYYYIALLLYCPIAPLLGLA